MRGPTAIELLPGPCRAAVAPLAERHGRVLWRALDHFGTHQGRLLRPAPHLPAEITPPYAWLWPAFEPWSRSGGTDPAALARAMHQVGLEGLLVLMGQRITPASLRDARAIPPTSRSLLAWAARPHSGSLTVSARAAAKHAARSDDPFWGAPHGSAETQSAEAQAKVHQILCHTTWWNVFGHSVSDVLFEARTASGHGARWKLDEQRFVGFLDPFEGMSEPESAAWQLEGD